jgi:hypothetical protein
VRGRPGQKPLETAAVEAYLGRNPAEVSDRGGLDVRAKRPIFASQQRPIALDWGLLGEEDVRVEAQQDRQSLERSERNVGDPLLERAHHLLWDPGQGCHLRY